MCRGIAAEMNNGLAASDLMSRSPKCRDKSLFGGSCSLFLTIADCAPAVERPSSHAAASMAPRNSTTSALLNTSGTQISISNHSFVLEQLELRRQFNAENTTGRDERERRRALIERVVIKLVEDVVGEQLPLPVLHHFAVDEAVEAPIAGQHRALIRRQQRAAVDFRTIGRLAADFEIV